MTLVNSAVRWTIRAATVLGVVFAMLVVVGMFVDDPMSPTPATADLAKTNPYARDIPKAQEATIEEVLFAAQTLRDGLLPTSLPDDDYTVYSDLLRSLETRSDISWTVIEETQIARTVMAIANRGSRFQPIPVEPLGLHARAKALHAHWSDLERDPHRPQRWEAAHDTTFLPPLLSAQSVEDSQPEGGTYRLSLTPQQQEQAAKVYKDWRQQRERKVGYLKIHPPSPLAWAPVSRDSDNRRLAWDTLFSDGMVAAGRQIAVSKLYNNPTWRPIYRSLDTERIPLDWKPPGEKEMTTDEFNAWLKDMNESQDRWSKRNKRQQEYQLQLKADLEAAEERELSARAAKEEL